MQHKSLVLWMSLFFFFLCTDGAQAQHRNKLYLEYIVQYHEIAVELMDKYKIAASITLAQGLLESGAG